ncbi:MAG TPA: DUF4159 domain-containing protein [Candidatus Ratteibacteria bacterium]|nr:DUF4159 domain-containing protein [bacterium]HON05073.1 DUF4159 domain-containing protein [bacterium]HPC29357.1 DUF4159 domain-containing protein [bacterium]HRS05894.1 DUF4159 domain-containing protein [Candidatus Ratteibacteria bacterium]HRV03934.1 DUF4159 domain-containing protein [Candidatus Ratteibacteria bacterium]
MKKLEVAVLVISFAVASSICFAWECGKAPPAKDPQRIKAGEAFPPLPLPATPLRRSERKNPPAPPVLVGKVICGSDESWTRAENDIENLLRLATQRIGVSYQAIKINLKGFSFDPDEIPILYITSVEPFIPDEETIEKIKEYLEKGGFLWVNASSGSPEFLKAMVGWIDKLYPDRNMYIAYGNHPIITCLEDITNVKVLRENNPSTESPNLRILNLGCRAAIILSPYDLGCGWALHTHPWGVRYQPEDAIKIGMNMLTYCLGWIEFGKIYGMTPLYVEKTKKKEGKLYIGQIVHSGDWDPHPSAVGKLLKKVSEQTGAPVFLDRIAVDLKKDSLKDTPILYITGHFNPNLSEIEIKKLREFLLNGGALFADSCCGSQEFTDSFRNLMKKTIPEAKITKWDFNHRIYKVPFKIERFQNLSENDPPLEIYMLKSLPVVIFSPYGVGSGWEGIPRPYTKEIYTEHAQQIGVNIITYLMTN